MQPHRHQRDVLLRSLRQHAAQHLVARVLQGAVRRTQDTALRGVQRCGRRPRRTCLPDRASQAHPGTGRSEQGDGQVGEAVERQARAELAHAVPLVSPSTDGSLDGAGFPDGGPGEVLRVGTSAWSRLAGRAARAAVQGAPALLRRVRTARTPTPGRGRPPHRPTGPRAGRALVYAPQLDGRADPGEVVWTWVDYEELDGRGKDRPVLVVGREGPVLLGLMLSSRQARDDQQHWLALGAGAWDSASRPSWVRLDRVLEVPEDGIRREGAVLERRRFEQVAQALRAAYGWT